MQKTRDHPNSRSGYVKEDVLKAISGFFIILAFIAVISLFAGMGGSSGGTSNSGSSDSKVIFVVNDMILEAPKDTTWEEFVSSEKLNSPGFTIVDNNVYLGDSKVVDSATNLPVTPDMAIDSNIEYKDESYTGEIGGSDPDDGGSDSSSLISFTIDGKTYQAESGMTWEQWAGSKYNTDGYSIGAHGQVCSPHKGNYYVNDGGSLLLIHENIIKSNTNYLTEYEPTGGAGGSN